MLEIVIDFVFYSVFYLKIYKNNIYFFKKIIYDIRILKQEKIHKNLI